MSSQTLEPYYDTSKPPYLQVHIFTPNFSGTNSKDNQKKKNYWHITKKKKKTTYILILSPLDGMTNSSQQN